MASAPAHPPPATPGTQAFEKGVFAARYASKTKCAGRTFPAHALTMPTQTSPERLRICRPRGLESVELRVGKSVQHAYPRHWHDEFFISAITAGVSHFYARDGHQVAVPGTLVLVAPGEVHAHYDGDCGRSFRSMHIPQHVARSVAADVAARQGSSTNIHSRMVQCPRLFRSFVALHRQLERHGAAGLRGDAMWLTFFSELARYTSGAASSTTHVAGRETCAIARAREFLAAHYNRAVSLKELATEANLSAYYFHRAFCRETGMPPHAYQIQLRILRAKKLLAERHSIAAVAAATGFADQSHFTRHFKRLLGITPGQFAGHGKNVQDAA